MPSKFLPIFFKWFSCPADSTINFMGVVHISQRSKLFLKLFELSFLHCINRLTDRTKHFKLMTRKKTDSASLRFFAFTSAVKVPTGCLFFTRVLPHPILTVANIGADNSILFSYSQGSLDLNTLPPTFTFFMLGQYVSGLPFLSHHSCLSAVRVFRARA